MPSRNRFSGLLYRMIVYTKGLLCCIHNCHWCSTGQYDYFIILHSFNGLFQDSWVSRHQKSRTILVKPIWNYWSKREWVAVAAAGRYANLHLAPDR